MYPFMPYPYSIPPPGGPNTTTEDMLRFYKRLKKMEEKHKHGDKKGGDNKRKWSPFTTLQWLIILTCLGPFVAPWTIVALINSWQVALAAMRQSLN